MDPHSLGVQSCEGWNCLRITVVSGEVPSSVLRWPLRLCVLFFKGLAKKNSQTQRFSHRWTNGKSPCFVLTFVCQVFSRFDLDSWWASFGSWGRASGLLCCFEWAIFLQSEISQGKSKPKQKKIQPNLPVSGKESVILQTRWQTWQSPVSPLPTNLDSLRLLVISVGCCVQMVVENLGRCSTKTRVEAQPEGGTIR